MLSPPRAIANVNVATTMPPATAPKDERALLSLLEEQQPT
jgi:hypothetical protein